MVEKIPETESVSPTIPPTEVIASILFLCRLNVARSQIGEVVNNLREGRPVAISAGTHADHALYGPVPTERVAKVVKTKFGYDLVEEGHRVKRVTPELMETITLTVVFCEPELCPDYLAEFGTRLFIRNLDQMAEELARYFETLPLGTLKKAVLYIPITDPDGAENEDEKIYQTAEIIENIINTLYEMEVMQHFIIPSTPSPN